MSVARTDGEGCTVPVGDVTRIRREDGWRAMLKRSENDAGAGVGNPDDDEEDTVEEDARAPGRC